MTLPPEFPEFPTDRVPSRALPRLVGGLLGGLIGDALGAPYEFADPDPDRQPEVYGRGVFGHAPGTGTDDTAVAHALAETIVEWRFPYRGGVTRRLVEWLDSDPLDVGHQTRRAITWHRTRLLVERVGRRSSQWVDLPRDDDAQGNGAVMAAWVLGLRDDPDEAAALGARYTMLTHPSLVSSLCCATVASVAAGGPLPDPDEEALDRPANGPQSGWCRVTTAVAVEAVRRVEAGEATAFRALADVVRLGGDTDTNASVAGALIGARNGPTVFAPVLVDSLDPDVLARTVRLAEWLDPALDDYVIAALEAHDARDDD